MFSSSDPPVRSEHWDTGGGSHGKLQQSTGERPVERVTEVQISRTATVVTYSGDPVAVHIHIHIYIMN